MEKNPYPTDTSDYNKVPLYPPSYDYTTATLNQPPMMVTMPPMGGVEKLPKSYLACSILNAFCCCLLLGIPAIIFSVKTREANKYGHVEQAMIYSNKAKKFNIIAFSVGLCIVILYIVFYTIKLNAELNH